MPTVNMISNLEYFQPSKADGARLALRLKYLQYRNNRDGHIPQDEGRERWIDCGLGKNWQAIARSAQQFETAKVLLWSVILSPNPALVEGIPREQHQRLMHEITVRFMEELFIERGLAVPPEFSFVVHHKDEVHGKAQPHAHVMIAASAGAENERMAFEIRKRHLDQVREISHRVAGQVIERYRAANQALERRGQGVPEHFPPMQPLPEPDERWQRPARQTSMFREEDDAV